MKRLMFLMLLVIMSSFAYAQAEVLVEVKAMSEEYKGQEIPGPIKLIFGNERINVYIDEIKVSVVTADGVVKKFQEGHLHDPTMNVYTSEATVKRIMHAQDFKAEAKKAYDNKEITYEGVGAGKKVKLFFVKIAAKIASWFM
jgi:uncharacterized membrane protein